MNKTFVLYSIAILCAICVEVAAGIDPRDAPDQIATDEFVFRGIHFLRDACTLGPAETIVVQPDVVEMYVDQPTSPMIFVLGFLALHDQWKTGRHYITGEPHETLRLESTDCCLTRAVEVSEKIYGADFANEVRPLYEKWVGGRV